jgi:hypothetical protein
MMREKETEKATEYFFCFLILIFSEEKLERNE